MPIPTIAYVHFAFQAVPIVAILRVRGRNATVPYQRVALWCAALITADVADLMSAAYRGYNLDISYFTLPVEVGLTLWVLAAWQPSEWLRLAHVIAIPLVCAATAAVLLIGNPAEMFSHQVTPALALLALIAVLHTLVHRTLLSRTDLLWQGWFWICLGMALFWTGFVTVPMFADMFLATRPDWVDLAYRSRFVANIGAFLMITWGVVCPRIPTRSFGFS